jgi:hypothetical protein
MSPHTQSLIPTMRQGSGDGQDPFSGRGEGCPGVGAWGRASGGFGGNGGGPEK